MGIEQEAETLRRAGRASDAATLLGGFMVRTVDAYMDVAGALVREIEAGG